VNEFILIAGMTAVTFVVRYPILALISRLTLPVGLIRALRYVPVAVLTAIIVPMMVLDQGAVALRPDNAYLVAGLVSIAIAWYSKKLLPTIVLGMAVFFLCRALTG
jgi:branched-subunit amino acid transport protein